MARVEQMQPGTMTERLREITAPTLILWGGRDRLIPPDHGARFRDAIGGSQLVVFDTLGTVAVVQRFLRGER